MKKRRKKTSSAYILVTGGILLIVAALLLLSQSSGDKSTTQPVTVADSHEEETYPEIPRVSIEEAKTAVDEGSAVVLDVRDAESYAISHMPGAINIPTNELASRLGELDKSAWIITYCT